MARRTAKKLPVSPEARDHLLAVIRSAERPVTAREVAARLVAPFRHSPAEITLVLNEFVAAGMLHAIPPKSPRGQSRYWDRDAGAITRAAVLDAVQSADAPLTAGELARRVHAPLKLTADELTQILEQSVLALTLHAIPAATSKGKPRYWNHNVLEFGRRAILRTLDERGPLPDAQLKKSVKGLNDAQFRQILDELLAARSVSRHPPLGKPRRERIGIHPPSPEPYLRELFAPLTKRVAQLTEANVSRDELRRALVQLVESAGVPFASSSAAHEAPRPEPIPVGLDLPALMRRIEPGADPGALVARDLRRAARIDKAQFDRAVLELARQGTLSLHRHDFVTSLDPAERDELVTDENGTYYVGMALRQADS